jgi:excisionase family DNA binding protein
MTDHRMPNGLERLTVSEAALRAGVSRQTVYDWFARRRLRPLLTDDGYRVATADLARLLAARRAAEVVGVGLGTVLHWIDGAAVDGA